MKAPCTDELAQLPEPLALQRHFDAKNYRYFRLILGLRLILSLVATAGAAKERRLGLMALMLVDLVAAILLVLLRRERFYSLYFRQILLGFLALQAVAIKVVNLRGDDSTSPFIPMMFALLGFRLRFIEHLMIYVLLWLTAVFPLTRQGLPSADALASADQFISVSIVGVVCLVVSAFIT